MVLPTVEKVQQRLSMEFLGSRLIDNTLRGYWCEAMLAEALGDECRVASHGWHLWDLQFGPDEAEFPERIRIQVKNSARLQPWNSKTGKLSEALFKLPFKKRPDYIERDWPGVPCEEYGFHCEVFALCYHPVEDPARADHRDPDQWLVYLLPVVGQGCALSGPEMEAARRAVVERGARVSYADRRPETLEDGIRNRPPVKPRSVGDLSVELIRSLLR